MWKKPILFLIIILAIGCFFRLWQIDLIPPGLYPDEAINGNDALDSLENNNFKVFYPENNGREGLYIWLLSFSFYIFGPSVWSIKIVSAFFGVLTILGLYLLTKEISKIGNLKNEAIALLASFFLAVSFWHINFSRIGFRAILIPFILTFGFYFLILGLRKKKIIPFIISGILFGLGFYTYISYRFVVLLGIIALIPWYFIYKKQNLKKQFIIYNSIFLILIFIVALPIGIYFLKNPGDFFGRAAGVSVFNSGNPILETGKSVISHLAMFNFYGDANWRHNFSGSPQLLWPVGIFFIIGLILCLIELIKPGKSYYSRFAVYGFLLSWFLIMLLPGFLSGEGIPHALRVIGVIPAVYIMAGMGAFSLFNKLKLFYKKRNIIVFYIIISVFLLSIAYAQFDKYFIKWAQNQETKYAFSQNFVKIGQYLNSLPDDIDKYVIVNQSGVAVPYPDGIPMPSQTAMFIEKIKYGKTRTNYILPENLEKVKIEKNTIFIPLQYDEGLFAEISLLFPGGHLEEIEEGIWGYNFK